MPGRPWKALAGLWVLAIACQAQAVGRLVYATGPGRLVRLDVLDGDHKAFITLPVLQGQAGQLRDFVLSHTGPERLIVPQGRTIPGKIPPTWKVTYKQDRRLLQTPEAIFWCYTPGLVIPVEFTLGRDLWKLQSADLPPRMFVSLDGR